MTGLTTAYYRIVRDNYAGYEVQIWRWWWPFWQQVSINTHRDMVSAEQYARGHAMNDLLARSPPLEPVYLGRLPRFP
jgi:hypothetical protein